MFLLYKLAGQLLMPLAAGLLVGLAATARWPSRRSRLALLVVLAGLWTLSLPVLTRQLLRLAEGRIPATPMAALPRADAVVVLSGDFPDRELCALHLLHIGRAPVLLFSGRMSRDDSRRLRQLLDLAGLDPDQLRYEQRSRTTSEGGRAFAAIAAREGWRRVLLVSSAYHLPRALSRYRSPGVELVGALCPELRLPEREVIARLPLEAHLGDWLPTAQGLVGSSIALRELAGRLVAR